MRKIVRLTACALGVCTAPAPAYENFIEIGPSLASADIEAAGIDDTASGFGLDARGRVFVEGGAFLQGDVSLAFTDGTYRATDYDFDRHVARLGVGAAGGVGEGTIMSAIWAEIAWADTTLDPDGASATGEDEIGGGVHLRFDRRDDDARFLPYAQIGYLAFEDFDGLEAKLGIRLNLVRYSPYVEARYADLGASEDGGNVEFRPLRLHAGVRLRF